ncbi:unnamed protein product, partial [Polarella glacialis]
MAATGLLKRCRRVLLDLSGTLHIEDTVTRNAPVALQKLRDSGRDVRFVTNTTDQSRRGLHSQLLQLGFEVRPEEIFTSLSAARQLVDARGLRPLLLLADGAMEEFEGVDTSSPNAVVIGHAPEHFHYERLREAFRVLMADETNVLVAVHKGRYFQGSGGFELGLGGFVAGLEHSTGRFFMGAVRDMGGSEDDLPGCVMIGDDARDDVGGALECGMQAVLVQTGKYRPGDEAGRACKAVAADFAAAVVECWCNGRTMRVAAGWLSPAAAVGTRREKDLLKLGEQTDWFLLRAGGKATIPFKGKACGLLTLLGPDAPTLLIRVDGGLSRRLTLLDRWCYYWRDAVVLLCDGLADETHMLDLEVEADPPDHDVLKRPPCSELWDT